MEYPLIKFTHRWPDNHITINHWYPEQWFAYGLLREAKKDVIYYDPENETITITVANGRAVYKVVEHCPDIDACRGELIESEFELEVQREGASIQSYPQFRADNAMGDPAR